MKINWLLNPKLVEWFKYSISKGLHIVLVTSVPLDNWYAEEEVEPFYNYYFYVLSSNRKFIDKVTPYEALYDNRTNLVIFLEGERSPVITNFLTKLHVPLIHVTNSNYVSEKLGATARFVFNVSGVAIGLIGNEIYNYYNNLTKKTEKIGSYVPTSKFAKGAQDLGYKWWRGWNISLTKRRKSRIWLVTKKRKGRKPKI